MKRSFDFKALTIGADTRRRGRTALVLAASLLVSACTAVPDWARPGGWFDEDTPPPSKISAAQDLEQAKSGEFPNLASVPDRPRTATPKGERAAIAKSLAADRTNAQYSGERLVAGATAASAAPAAPAIAQGLGAAVAQATVPPAAAPAPAPSATTIAPAPAPAIQSPAQGTAEIATPAPRAQQAAVAPLVAQPRTSELAGIIYFANGSDALDANDKSVLRDIVALSQERDARIRVIGHASSRTGTLDPVEHRIVNLEISQRRAEAVTAALVRMGAKRDRIRTEARADTLPVYHEFMPTGEAGNRRAEIFLEY
jgi:outer membrane protein OmpA-like peptidoglycan-associated protein